MQRKNSPNILLVEDAPADTYVIRRAVADCCPQSHVWTVATGSDALAFLLHEPPFTHVPTPALILLDLNIPRPDGYILLALLRRLAAYHEIPVVVVSASEKATEEPRCRQLGANAYVQKSRDYATYAGGIQATIRDWLATD